jgi:CheY-like chemotaxis protein
MKQATGKKVRRNEIPARIWALRAGANGSDKHLGNGFDRSSTPKLRRRIAASSLRRRPRIRMISARRVLIIEDEMLIADHLAALLERSGWDVTGRAMDAETAMVIAEREKPGFAIVDVTLQGGINGMTVGRELATRYGTRIVFVTGHLDQAVRQVQDINAVFVGKPFTDDEILSSLEEAELTGPRA